MNNFFEVQVDDIKNLSPENLTLLLNKLLLSEASSHGIPSNSIEVGSNINASDGGEDGRIKWKGDPVKTDFLPSNFVIFQCKAVNNFGPKDCANEIVDSSGSVVKPMLDEAFNKGATYILFTTLELNQKEKKKRISEIKKKLKCLNTSYAETLKIEIYDSSVIKDWVNKFLPVIVSVLGWNGRNTSPGLITWEEWSEYEYLREFEYVEDCERKKQQEKIRELITKEKECYRIIGLSGLGKTRMAFELCRACDGDGFNNRVVYFDAANIGNNPPSFFHSFIRREIKGIVVVDNCDVSLHKKLRDEVGRVNSKLSLLTLDHNLELSDTPYVTLKPLDNSKIKAMLEQKYGKNLIDSERVVRFAQGFPQMAVLLANARLKSAENIGTIQDSELVNRLLGGDKLFNKNELDILRFCSLFDKFGFEESASEEYKFMAQFTEIDQNQFYECIKRQARRGIIDRRGRYAQLRPKPLAIHLASEWWKNTTPERQKELIQSEMPGQLQDSFCNQIALLDLLPEVKKFTEGLCGIQGPFGQAEVILSSKGSRLFCSLVEVDPESTSKALHKVFSEFNFPEFHNIRGDVRRNLVIALEKLCFHKIAFNKSAECLMWLAAAENEVWINNASGQFKQLFRVFLSGTEATPNQRMELIDQAIDSEEPKIRRVAVSALSSALSYGHESRRIGAEYQGSNQILREWRPEIWKDAFDYWIDCIKRLTEIVLDNNEQSEFAKEALAIAIYKLIRTGDPVIAALNSSIHKIVSNQGPYWPSAHKNIINAKKSLSSKNTSHATLDYIEKWGKLLTPTELEDRLKSIVSDAPYEQKNDETGNYIDIAELKAKNLAEELSNAIDEVLNYFDLLSSGEHQQSYVFGKYLVIYSKKWKKIFNQALFSFSKADQPNPRFLKGVLVGINELDNREWESCMEEIFNHELLRMHYPELIITGTLKPKHFNKILELIQTGLANETSALFLTRGQPMKHLKPRDIINFVNQLKKFSNKSEWISLDLLYYYCFRDDLKWTECKNTFQELLCDLKFKEEYLAGDLVMYLWKDTAEKLLKNDPEFAKKLTGKILSSWQELAEFGNLNNDIRPILRILLKKYGEFIWPIIAKFVKNSDSSKKSFLGFLFRYPVMEFKDTRIISDLPLKYLDRWCKLEPSSAPLFVAIVTDVFLDDGENFKISKTAKYLLDNFGNNQELLKALSFNIASFGWSGSAVPIYQKQKSALEYLDQSKYVEVGNWKDQEIMRLQELIKQETKRDEEFSWGIYS